MRFLPTRNSLILTGALLASLAFAPAASAGHGAKEDVCVSPDGQLCVRVELSTKLSTDRSFHPKSCNLTFRGVREMRLLRSATRDSVSLFIESHTDNRGSARTNQKLAACRSVTVRRALTQGLRGTDLPQLSHTVNWAGRQPRTANGSNATAAERAYNRRLEIKIVRRSVSNGFSDLRVSSSAARILPEFFWREFSFAPKGFLYQ